MNNISEKTLEAIVKEQVKPLPKWLFITKDLAIWTIGLSSLGLGAFSLSLVVNIIDGHDWDIYDRVGGYFNIFVLSLPYLWLLSFTFFVVLAHYYFRHSRHGYKYSLIILSTSTVTSSLALGLIIHYSGLSQIIHCRLADSAPDYEKNFDTRVRVWQRPTNGLLGGIIIKTGATSPEDLDLEDFEKHTWHIVVSDGTIIKQKDYLSERKRIKIIGQKINDHEFSATEIRPWEGSGVKIRKVNQ